MFHRSTYRIFVVCILLVVSNCVYSSHNFGFIDLEALGLNCDDRFSCEGKGSNSKFDDMNCECDSACNTYNDCCIDARRRTSSSSRLTARTPAKMCLPVGGLHFTGIYVVNTCSSTWTGPSEVRRMCQGTANFSDPLNAAPVIAVQQGVSYRNRYCAECNDANPATLTSFQVLMNCDDAKNSGGNITDDYIWGNLEYRASDNKWGVYRWSERNQQREFYTCHMGFKLPDYVTRGYRQCRANTISSCPRSWRREQVKRACLSYTAVVYSSDESVAYRNPHCAMCNGLRIDQMSCVVGLNGRNRRPMSFALLLDVNQSDGDRVGMTRVPTPSCPSGQKYDPFFKRCRQLVCALPGYKMVNGRCTRS